MQIADVESLFERVEGFFAEVKSGTKAAQYKTGRARTLRAEVSQAIESVGQLLEELRGFEQSLNRILRDAKSSSVPTVALP